MPESGIDRGELAAVLVTETPPLKVPVAVGANVTLNADDWPAAKVTGTARPLTLKLVPAKVSFDTLMDAFPVFVRVTACLLLAPGETLPKATAEGFADKLRLCEMPVPATGTLTGVELLPMLTVPAAFPATAGEKRTVRAMELPGVTVTGSAEPLILNPVPVTVVCETIKLAFPESLRVSV